MLKRIKLSNSTKLLTGILVIGVGISIGFYEYFEERKNKTFCSDSCCKVYWMLHKDKQRRLVPQKYNCLICDKEYYEYPARIVMVLVGYFLHM